MDLVCLKNKATIEIRLRRNTALHLYELGDLDDFFWPYTTWYTLDNDPSTPIILLYTGATMPVLIALEPFPSDQMKQLIKLTLPVFPKIFYSHLTEELVEEFRESHQVASHGNHLKMILTEPAALGKIDSLGVEPLSSRNLAELKEFYTRSNPINWFDPRMLNTGYYFGIRSSSRLVSVAGIHAHSQRYRIGILGNIATDPYFRGAGLATRVCAGLCRHLLKSADNIGLNVESTNQPAISCFHRLGFTTIGHYQEHSLRLKSA